MAAVSDYKVHVSDSKPPFKNFDVIVRAESSSDALRQAKSQNPDRNVSSARKVN